MPRLKDDSKHVIAAPDGCRACRHLQVLHKRRGVEQAGVAAGAAPVGGTAAALLAQQGQGLG